MSDFTNLLDRCRDGDPQAFEALFEAHMARLYRLAVAILHDEKDAEDAVQETLLRVFRKFKGFRREASFETWITRILINICRDHLRRQKLRRAVSLEWLRERPDPDQVGPAELADQRLQRQAIWAQVDRMEDRYRLPLLLVYLDGLPVAQAARVLGLPVRTVYARLQHAYDELGQALSDQPFALVAELDGERC